MLQARNTLRELIEAQTLARPREIAILAPGRADLSFGALWSHIQQTGERLRALGIRRGDLVASVLPNGPDAATAVLSVSSVATFVPLNPDGRKPEYDSIFLDLTPRLLLVPAGLEAEHPAARAARSLGIPVIGVVCGKEAGAFSLEGRSGIAPAGGEPATADDFAYILTTSGTTARPKLVPLPHRAACLAIAASSGSMRLAPADRSLNISPLFHSMGLVSGVFATLSEGGSVVCLPNFQVTQFFDQLVEYQATYFAAVPAVLQSIAEHAPANREKLERSSVRVIRTVGAALSPKVADQLERELRAKIIHVYGMTEAPCIASEQYPIEVRKRGSVGRPAHAGVSVVDENGEPVAAGFSGEIVVRGPWIIPGYYRNEAATSSVFENGWFHTGDVGYFDADGFLFITGRRKEFINRGGEKVSPVEVDEVLLSHPSVAEAVTFAIPNARLGEEIAAAIVLRSGSDTSVAALQEFAATHLSVTKVPRQIVFVKQLPKGPSGKLSRFRVAAELGLDKPDALPRDTRAPAVQAPELEEKIAAIFARVLRLPSVDPHANFFDLGGDSMGAVQCLAEIQATLSSVKVSAALFLWAPTPAKVAAAILNPEESNDSAQIISLQLSGSGVPLFLVSPGMEARALAKRLGPDRPLFGLRIPNLEHLPPPHTLERIAAECVRTLRRSRPSGAYALGGWCSAGVIALEIARQLEEAGERVAFVALFDARGVLLPAMSPARRRLVRAVRLAGKLRFRATQAGRLRWLRQAFAARNAQVALVNNVGLRQYRPHPWTGRVVHVWAAERPRGRFLDPMFEWGHVSPGGFTFYEVPGDHFSMLAEPNVLALARILATELDGVLVPATARPVS